MQRPSQQTLLPQSNVGCGFIIGRFHPRHNDDDGCRMVPRGLHIHDNVFRCEWDTVVFTGSFYRTANPASFASKQHSWKAPNGQE